MRFWFHKGRLAWHHHENVGAFFVVYYGECRCGHRTYAKGTGYLDMLVDWEWLRGERDDPRHPDTMRGIVEEKERRREEAMNIGYYPYIPRSYDYGAPQSWREYEEAVKMVQWGIEEPATSYERRYERLKGWSTG